MQEIITILLLQPAGFRWSSAAVTARVSASDQLREKWRKSSPLATVGHMWASKTLDSYWDSNALAVQQSHKAAAPLQDSPALWPHRETLPPSALEQPHVLACRCSSALGELPRGSLTAVLQCCSAAPASWAMREWNPSRQGQGFTWPLWQAHYLRDLYQGKTPYSKLPVPLLR